MDVDSIHYGTNFLASIERHIILADVVLVLIGPLYKGQPGERRLKNQDDFVRLELELALRHQKRILPILVGTQTQMPSQADLPPSLLTLPFLNAVRFSAATLSPQDQHQLLRFISAPFDPNTARVSNETGAQAPAVPQSSQVQWVKEGEAHEDAGRYREALAAYDRALQLDPNDADAHNGRGNVLKKLQRYEEALEAYDQAIQLDPHDAGFYSNKSMALNALKRYEEALAASDYAIQLAAKKANTSS